MVEHINNVASYGAIRTSDENGGRIEYTMNWKKCHPNLEEA